jgi:hypothetical protein
MFDPNSAPNKVRHLMCYAEVAKDRLEWVDNGSQEGL